VLPFRHLTTRACNPLKANQAKVAIAAALLRQLFVVVTRRVAWDPAIAAGGEVVAGAGLIRCWRGRGEPAMHLGRTRD
jgi:hypothetical protein